MGDAATRVVDQAGAGIDVMVQGSAPHGRALLADAAAVLADRAEIVSVSSRAGELSLSSLIAQLSGQADLGGQDDAVLETGFKRLTGPGPKILLLDLPEGISRSALRYLQHVSRQAPALVLAVVASPAFEALLEEPGFAALRSRLRAAPPIAAAMPLVPAVTAVPVLATPAARGRRPALWAASAIGIVAALAAIAWVGHSPTRAQEEVGRRTMQAVPSTAALVPAAPLAGRVDAPVVRPSMPPPLARSLAGPAHPAAIVAATQAPPPAAPSNPATKIPLASATVPDPSPQPRRPEPARIAHMRPPKLSSPRQYQPPADYAWDRPYEYAAPRWYRPEPRWREAPYPEPYAYDIYGRPIFR